ncbi:MAG: hypothetical protein KBS70_07090 [Bacteroidales bacterium]|nr:hypothetical protein [Candidatus Colicola equi]
MKKLLTMTVLALMTIPACKHVPPTDERLCQETVVNIYQFILNYPSLVTHQVMAIDGLRVDSVIVSRGDTTAYCHGYWESGKKGDEHYWRSPVLDLKYNSRLNGRKHWISITTPKERTDSLWNIYKATWKY